jgi:hypothetical protein
MYMKSIMKSGMLRGVRPNAISSLSSLYFSVYRASKSFHTLLYVIGASRFRRATFSSRGLAPGVASETPSMTMMSWELCSEP